MGTARPPVGSLRFGETVMVMEVFRKSKLGRLRAQKSYQIGAILEDNCTLGQAQKQAYRRTKTNVHRSLRSLTGRKEI